MAPKEAPVDIEAALLAAVDEAHAPLRDALGRLVIAFGQCELAAAELTAVALGAGNADARDSINAVLSFRQKLDLIAAMAFKRLNDPNEAQLLSDVLTTLAGFEEERNTLLHSKYQIKLGPEMYFNPTGFSRSKQRAHRKKGLVRVWTDVDVQAIDKLSRRIASYTSTEPQGLIYTLYNTLRKARA
jgi:hypothetical protein